MTTPKEFFEHLMHIKEYDSISELMRCNTTGLINRVSLALVDPLSYDTHFIPNKDKTFNLYVNVPVMPAGLSHSNQFIHIRKTKALLIEEYDFKILYSHFLGEGWDFVNLKYDLSENQVVLCLRKAIKENDPFYEDIPLCVDEEQYETMSEVYVDLFSDCDHDVYQIVD